MVSIQSKVKLSIRNMNRMKTIIYLCIIGVLVHIILMCFFEQKTFMESTRFQSTNMIQENKIQTIEDHKIKPNQTIDFSLSPLDIPLDIQKLLNEKKKIQPQCLHKKYDIKSLPTASIIIPMRTESWPNLWRTLESIFTRTPDALLAEVIVLDDFNQDDENPKTPIEILLRSARHHFPTNKLIIHRTNQREGLINLKNIGVQFSTGQVLVFLEGHVEVQEKWLEPLVLRIQQNPHAAVLPMHDFINEDTLKARLSFYSQVGTFDCRMIYHWEDRKELIEQMKKDPTKEVPSPTMPGGLFAIDKNWWFEVGEYDDKMKVWGGENIELSFRLWRCGGSIEFMPCSHVAHLFRRKFPYKVSNDIEENLMRVSAIWTNKEYRDKCEYYQDNVLLDPKRLESLSSRIELQKKLECKDMQWYFKELYPNGYNFKQGKIEQKAVNYYQSLSKKLTRRFYNETTETLPSYLLDNE